MQWHKADFQLQNGDKFTIMHALPIDGDNSIDKAFTQWGDTHLAVELPGVDVSGDFIRYINAHASKSGGPGIWAMRVENYKVEPDEVTDTSIMPFGQHIGKRMIDIPAQYLLYIYDKGWVHHAGVRKYIITNELVLKSQSKNLRR